MTLIERVRRLCLALPEAFEVETWEHPTFRVGSGRGKMFCIAAEDGSSVTLKADPAEREAVLAQGDPFYTPAYVGHKGWVGIRVDDPEEPAEARTTQPGGFGHPPQPAYGYPQQAGPQPAFTLPPQGPQFLRRR